MPCRTRRIPRWQAQDPNPLKVCLERKPCQPLARRSTSQTFLLHETRVRRLVGLAALYGLVMTLSVKGVENLQHERSCIVAANHLTNPRPIAAPTRPALGRVLFMAKAELLTNPLSRLAPCGWSGPAWRQRPDGRARHVLEGGLARGNVSEGTRSGHRGSRSWAQGRAPVKNVPILRLGIDGSQAMFSGFPRRKRVHLSARSSDGRRSACH